jgi:hypothetical protein
MAFLDEIMLPYTCSDVQGLDPGSTGLRFKKGPSHRKIIIITNGQEGGFTSSIQRRPNHSPLVFRPACDRVVQSGAVAACQPLAAHNHNRLQNPCCGTRDWRASCLAPSRCVYRWARSYAGRCKIQRLCMHTQYLSVHEDRFSS